MKLILNSDIIFSKLLKDRCPKTLESLLRECAKRGDIIVIPQTTLLESDRIQRKFAEDEIGRLEAAYQLLESIGIKYERRDPKEVIKEPNLVELFKTYGVTVVVEDPTLEDYQEAHNRACLHELPHPPETKHDEMRDLIIWVMAIRIAKQEGSALLISRDKVHTNPTGNEEALSSGLVRVQSIDEAFEYLGVDTPAGLMIKKLLEPAWEELTSKLHISETIGITDSKFTLDDQGFLDIKCIIKFRTGSGKTMKADMHIKISGRTVERISLWDISVDGNPWEEKPIELAPKYTFETEEADYLERYSALKEILGGT